MPDKIISVNFSKFYHKISFDENLERKIEVIKKNDGRVALVKDRQSKRGRYLMGIIEFIDKDYTFYNINVPNRDFLKEISLEYENLQEILVSRPDVAFSREFKRDENTPDKFLN